MNTSLNSSGNLPLNQPFSGPPWNYSGNESVTAFPTDIVDWILVDFRETPGGPENATEATSIFRKAFLLRDDGYLVNLNGSREITVSIPEINDNIYLVIWHHNHLSILSNSAITFINDVYYYDFTSSASQAYGNVQNDLGGGVFGLVSGDANADGTINELDDTDIWINEVGKTGYLQSDLNLDAQADNKDKNDLWQRNQGKSEILPE